jgi:outer membrane protein assembly factor BamE (lipoprotein component of BamABCDE complex)
MAVLSKPVNKMIVIKKEASQQFIHEFNKNQVTKEFMDSCKKAGKLFERTRRKEH